MRPLIVNGNQAYARYLIERCGLPEDTEVMDTVTPEDIRGRHVFGNLPPQLAAHAGKISQLSVPGGQGIRMSKMSLAQFRYFGGDITTYRVQLLATSPAPRR